MVGDRTLSDLTQSGPGHLPLLLFPPPHREPKKLMRQIQVSERPVFQPFKGFSIFAKGAWTEES